MSLVFYYAPMSSASPTHWVLEELGVPYEKVKIDLQSGEQKQPAFLKINPNGKVPVLVHDGTVIFESVAIAIHLGETFGVERGLFPAPGMSRAEAIKWLVWCNVSLGEAVSRLFHNTSDRIPAELRNAKAGEVAKTDIERNLRILEEALAGKSYLLGDSFSIVDAHVSAWTTYLGFFGFDLQPYPAISAWAARCSARPAAAKIQAG
ncbi:MAG: glutathione S-transferase family protein [Polyangiaceae bacterium]|nr:glutathione S-transferase family protein [Polyangiaceae bacterium]